MPTIQTHELVDLLLANRTGAVAYGTFPKKYAYLRRVVNRGFLAAVGPHAEAMQNLRHLPMHATVAHFPRDSEFAERLRWSQRSLLLPFGDYTKLGLHGALSVMTFHYDPGRAIVSIAELHGGVKTELMRLLDKNLISLLERHHQNSRAPLLDDLFRRAVANKVRTIELRPIFLGGYPGGAVKLFERIAKAHGFTVDSRGSLAVAEREYAQTKTRKPAGRR